MAWFLCQFDQIMSLHQKRYFAFYPHRKLLYNQGMAKSIRAENQNWLLIEKIGSGDAGEVWRVEAETTKQRAVLKRPVQNVSGGTIMRQANQIETEGQILADLDGIDSTRNNILVHTPLLIDKSIEGTSGTSGLFIISEEVSGVSINHLSDQLRLGQSAFSQVLTLKVLAAAFQLLRQVHAKGIVWNDVKMDHIFWDEAQNKMSFIDWGNGLRFDPEAAPDKVNPAMDFQQLIDEGRQLLVQISPVLIQDLGWPLSAKGLNDLDTFHLQMRVEYLENHLAMRVLEYQLLFDKYLQSADDIASINTVLDLKKALERLGVKVEDEKVLAIARKLWLSFLVKNDAESGYKLCQILEENLPLDPKWQLAIYFFKALQAHAHDELHELISTTLNEQWSDAIWVFKRNFDKHFKPEDAKNILLSMRNLFDLSTPGPIILPDSLVPIQKDLDQNISRLSQENSLSPELLSQLKTIQTQLNTNLENWSVLAPNEALGESLLKTRELLGQLTAMGLSIPPNIQLGFTKLLGKIREVYRAWANAELEQAQKLLRELFMLDPNLDYLHDLDNEIHKTGEWVEELKTGPQGEQTLNQFGDYLINTLPSAYHKLGTPGWLTAMYSAATSFKNCQDLQEMRAQLKQIGMPLTWSEYTGLRLEFQTPTSPLAQLNESQETALANFHKALANKNNAQEELEKVKLHLPNYAFLYASLNEKFQQAWLLQTTQWQAPDLSDFPPPDQSRVQEALLVLKFIHDWRQSTQTRSLGLRHKVPQTKQKWAQIEDIVLAGKRWQDLILPTLGRIKQKEWDSFQNLEPKQSPYPDLIHCLRHLSKLHQAWKSIENQGIFPENLADMISHVSQAQNQFYAFWQSLENSEHATNRWLAMVHQGNLSEINQTLLLIMRQLQAVARGLDVLNNPGMARTRLALNSAGEMMFTLVSLNDLILPPSRDFNLYRHWRQQYLDLIQQGNVYQIRENIQSIESIHPLLPWLDELLRRDTDFFKVPDEQRW